MVAVLSLQHFDLPFRWGPNGHGFTVDQDTIDDVSNCVEAIVRTMVGQRAELPDFGIIDPTFDPQPLNLQDIIQRVIQQEPRAALLMEQAPDRVDQLIAHVIAKVSTAQGVTR